MRQNYYYVVLANGKVEAFGNVRAWGKDKAEEMVYEAAGEVFQFERFKEITWEILVSARPFPTYNRTIDEIQASGQLCWKLSFFKEPISEHDN